jgi:methylsterol monooxygenase
MTATAGISPALEEEGAKDNTLAKKDESPDVIFLTRVWSWISNQIPDPLTRILGGVTAVHLGVYWISGLSMLGFEKLLASDSFIARYKTQPKKSVSGAEILKLLKVVIPNHIFLGLGAWLVSRKLRPKIAKDVTNEMCERPIPSAKRIMLDYAFNLLCFEVIFYATHRLLHQKRFYLRIHKLHHQFKSPIGLASEYAHLSELLFSNIIPGVVGSLITGSHPLSDWIWLSGSILMTNIHHSGFCWPWYPFNNWTIAHDYHHKAFYYQHVSCMKSERKWIFFSVSYCFGVLTRLLCDHRGSLGWLTWY